MSPKLYWQAKAGRTFADYHRLLAPGGRYEGIVLPMHDLKFQLDMNFGYLGNKWIVLKYRSLLEKSKY